MSRNEGRMESDGSRAVDATEILQAVAEELAGLERNAAVARYLAAGEGWKEASARLGGAFAADARDKDG